MSEARPWDGEPDQFEFEAFGLPALGRRNPELGNWCGYAGVGIGHPLYRLGIEAADERLDVHGGITYAGPILGAAPEFWFFGFDCAHAWDVVPGFVAMGMPQGTGFLKAHYRGVDFVRHECANLAGQLAEMGAASNDAPQHHN